MIKISFEYDEEITSIGRRNFNVNLHSVMPNGFIAKDDRRLYSWNCVCDENKSYIPRILPSSPISMRESNFAFTFE